MCKALAKFRQEFHIGQNEHGDQSNPYLGHYRVFAGPEEGLDLQVLLEPLEKQLHLPAGFVDIGNRFRGKFEVVGQKDIVFARFRIAVAYPPQRDWAIIGLRACQHDGLIGCDILRFDHRASFNNLELDIFLEPGHKEVFPLVELEEPGKINICSIRSDN